MALIPHFDLPFRFGKYAEQGSQRDLSNCVFAVIACPRGFRQEKPNFGIEDPTFSRVPVFTEDVKNNIKNQEPRADMLFDEQEGRTQLERLVKIVVQDRP